MRAKLTHLLLAIVAVSLASSVSTLAQERSTTIISDIRQESNDRSTRLTVECDGPLAYTYYSPDPLTLVVDIPEVDASKVPSRINVGTREVESLRVTSMARADGRQLARIEVRLASLVPYQIFSKDKSLNLVFERSAAASAVAPKAMEAQPERKPAGPVEAPAVEPPPARSAKASDHPATAEPQGTPAPSAAPAIKTGGRASKILGVTPEVQGGQVSVAVQADGSLKYQDFFLGNPDRLVIDFADVVSRAPIKALEVNQGPVRKVRLAQFSAASPKVARLVLDLSSRSPYRVVEGKDGLKILFGEGQTPSPAPLAALRTEPPLEPEPLQLPPAPSVAQGPIALPVPVLPEPQVPNKEQFEPTTVGPSQKVYTGHPISLDFKDGDLQDIFRLFADISGLNVVVNPGITGKVTLKLTQVPWDQALDIILKTNKLGKTLDDNVIRIAKLTDLQQEETDLRNLKEQQALAGDLVTFRKTLSYAKASELEPTIRKVVLSPRGNITLDTRTNTMIITDLPSRLEDAKSLIAELDRGTPQVEIEARIVVTSRTFQRQIGIQWGFLNNQTAQFGNTTSRAFPNSIILNGAGAGGGGLATGSNNAGYAVNLPASSFNSALGLTMGNILGNFNLDAALTALEQQGRGRVLSSPKVTTQNNKAAEIEQGVEIPVVSTTGLTTTVSFKKAVLNLKVTPQITDAGTVILDVEIQNDTPDFSRAVGTGPGASVPPINKQSAKTIVLMRDGSTTVIGGVYQSTEQTNRQNTPLLGNLPVLGYLFRNKSMRSENAELLVFITPRIVKL